MKYGKVLLGVALWTLVVVLPVLAEDAADSNAAQLLTQNLYCDGRALLEGPLGLLVGLIFVCMGVWQWIEGGKMKTIAIYIVMGGIITAIPTLINAFLEGYSSMLREAGVSTSAESADFISFANNCRTASQDNKIERDDHFAAISARPISPP
jgi:uncharacterized membrane protein